MACYKPMIRAEKYGKWRRAKDGHYYQDFDIFSSNNLESFDIESKYQKYELIPCGKCIGCRLDYSRQWANRGYLHTQISKNNYFITLTYDKNHLPQPEEITTSSGITFLKNEFTEWKGCLKRSDVDKFLHDLRREFANKGHTGIDYMLAGEYGSLEARPHYHLILMNCPFPVESFYNPKIINGEMYYQNHILEKCWKNGISNISEVTWNNIAYVARYITKKQNGPYSEEDYAIRGQIKEFFSASNRPGIGYDYFQANKEKIYENDYILIKNKKGIHKVQPPKYFDKLLEKEEPEKMKEIKRNRKIRTLKNARFKDTLTSLSRYEQLKIEHATKEMTAMALKREL